MVIFAVRLEVILKLQNTLAQDCNLDFWRPGIGFVNSVLRYDLLFCVCRQCHSRKDTPRLDLIAFVPYKDNTRQGVPLGGWRKIAELAW